MSDEASSTAHLLPHGAPDRSGNRLLLLTIRRMGVGGLNDAQAAFMLIGSFGLSFRRPLILVRALMAEVARASQRTIMIAPSCCCRMTDAESILLDAVAVSLDTPGSAHRAFGRLLGVETAIGVLSSAQAVAQAFADLGRPLDG